MPSLVDSADPPLREHVVYLLSQLGRGGKRLLSERLQEHGLTMRYMAALSVLDEVGAVSQVELGRRLGLDPSDVTVLADELADLGLATRVVDPADRRRRRIHLTGAGERALATSRTVTRRVDDELMAGLSPTEQDLLRAVLDRMLTGVRSTGS